MKRLIVVFILALSGIAMTAPPCWACSCAGASKEEQADSADAVFYGKVVKVSGGDLDNGTYGDDNIRVRVWVKTVYKGKNIDQVEIVRTNESGAACGYEGFEKGRRYTIFADRSEGKLFTNLCSGTKRGDINPDNYGLPEGSPPKG